MRHGIDAAKSVLACADLLASVLAPDAASDSSYGTLRGSSARERGLATLYRRFLGATEGGDDDDGGEGEDAESEFATFDNEAVCGRPQPFKLPPPFFQPYMYPRRVV